MQKKRETILLSQSGFVTLHKEFDNNYERFLIILAKTFLEKGYDITDIDQLEKGFKRIIKEKSEEELSLSRSHFEKFNTRENETILLLYVFANFLKTLKNGSHKIEQDTLGSWFYDFIKSIKAIFTKVAEIKEQERYKSLVIGNDEITPALAAAFIYHLEKEQQGSEQVFQTYSLLEYLCARGENSEKIQQTLAKVLGNNYQTLVDGQNMDSYIFVLLTTSITYVSNNYLEFIKHDFKHLNPQRKSEFLNNIDMKCRHFHIEDAAKNYIEGTWEKVINQEVSFQLFAHEVYSILLKCKSTESENQDELFTFKVLSAELSRYFFSQIDKITAHISNFKSFENREELLLLKKILKHLDKQPSQEAQLNKLAHAIEQTLPKCISSKKENVDKLFEEIKEKPFWGVKALFPKKIKNAQNNSISAPDGIAKANRIYEGALKTTANLIDTRAFEDTWNKSMREMRMIFAKKKLEQKQSGLFSCWANLFNPRSNVTRLFYDTHGDDSNYEDTLDDIVEKIYAAIENKAIYIPPGGGINVNIEVNGTNKKAQVTYDIKQILNLAKDAERQKITYVEAIDRIEKMMHTRLDNSYSKVSKPEDLQQSDKPLPYQNKELYEKILKACHETKDSFNVSAHA